MSTEGLDRIQRESAPRSLVKQAVADAKADFDHINARSFEYQALKREAMRIKLCTKNWSAKSRKRASTPVSRTVPSGSPIRRGPPQSGVPRCPVERSTRLPVFGAGRRWCAVLSDILDKTIRDPEQVSRTLRTEVIGSLPLMKNRRSAGSPNFKAGFKNEWD